MIVVDASVVLKWLIRDPRQEPDTERAVALMESVAGGRLDVVQPFHWLAEVAAVLARLSPGTAAQDAVDLYSLRLPATDDPVILHRACRLATAFGVHVFDSLYHAVAMEHPEATLVTADVAYYRAANRAGRIVLLDHWQ
jgi:predicted nucleic acid-binding protein